MPLATRRRIVTAAMFAPLIALGVQRAHAATPQTYANDGVAVDGTDVVAYFTDGKPIPGDAAYAYKWNGAVWRFSTDENRAAFAENPEAYAPQYGGYCAYAVSEGYTASTDPAAWSIVDGRLYLNYSRSVRALWNVSRTRRIRDGDANWPEVLN